MADKGFHTHAGWIAFNVIGLSLVMASRRIRYFAKSGVIAEEVSSSGVNPTAAFLVPLLSILATTMVTGAISAGFDRFYAARVCAAAAALWYFRRDYAGLRLTSSWTAVLVGLIVFVLWLALETNAVDSSAETTLSSGIARLGALWGLGMARRPDHWLGHHRSPCRRACVPRIPDPSLDRDGVSASSTWPVYMVVLSALFGAVWGVAHGRWLARCARRACSTPPRFIDVESLAMPSWRTPRPTH